MTDRVVITGGAGFLGSRLTERLPAEGHQVVCLDNFCTGDVDNVARRPARTNAHSKEPTPS